MNKKLYLVFSVTNARKLLKAARDSQRAHHAKPSHCIVLRGLKVVEFEASDENQLCSCSFLDAIDEVNRTTQRTLKVLKS